MGTIWAARGGPFRAGSCFQQVKELAPRDVDARLGLARALLAVGNRTATRAETLEILKLEPGNGDALMVLAETSFGEAEVGELPAKGAESRRCRRQQHIVQRMLDYLQSHYYRPIQLGDLAGASKMNACYLFSLFSAKTGVTCHRYLEELRMTKAKELLADPVVFIGEVACATGYTSAGNLLPNVQGPHRLLTPCMEGRRTWLMGILLKQIRRHHSLRSCRSAPPGRIHATAREGLQYPKIRRFFQKLDHCCRGNSAV